VIPYTYHHRTVVSYIRLQYGTLQYRTVPYHTYHHIKTLVQSHCNKTIHINIITLHYITLHSIQFLLLNSIMSIKIAVLGFGLMGTAVAKTLVESKKYTVYGWNRTSSKIQAVDGIHIASSIADAIKDAKYIFSSLTDDKAVHAVYNEVIPKAEKGQIYIEMSTVCIYGIIYYFHWIHIHIHMYTVLCCILYYAVYPRTVCTYDTGVQ
jgi:hypothetical protein